MNRYTAYEGGRHTALVLAACTLVLLPTLTFRMGVDQGVFAYMSAALLEGKWPYVGTWESDFPGLIFLQAVQMLVLGKSIVAFRAFDLGVQVLSAFLIHRIARRTSGWIAATIAPILFCLIYQGYGPWNTAQREGFGLVFILAGFWFTLSAEKRPPLVTAVLAGLGLGVAVTIKPTLLALSLFYLPLVLHLRSRRAWGVAVAGGAALVLPAAAIVAGYWATGTLTEIYEACVAYQAIYTARLRGDGPLVVYWLQKLRGLGVNAVVLPVLYAPFLALDGRRQRERLMLWLAYLGATYAVFVQGTFAGYHYLPGLALGAVFVGEIAGTSIEWVMARWHGPKVVGRVPVAVVLVVLALVPMSAVYLRRAPVGRFLALTFMRPPTPGEFRNHEVFDFTEAYDTAAYLRARTQPGEPIHVWGYESLVYFLADRPAATRFQMTHPLVMREPGRPLTPMQLRWRAEFLADVTARPPAYVAVVRDDRWWWSPEERSSEELLDDFPEWRAIIAARYALERSIGRYLIYRRVPGAGAPSASAR
ncbi:MAG TPA: hypothetical protein VMW48_09725 [Vicinamibacterales bacterium]|nr:hypothetical protein [Vicinamibacterales bacterium]